MLQPTRLEARLDFYQYSPLRSSGKKSSLFILGGLHALFAVDSRYELCSGMPELLKDCRIIFASDSGRPQFLSWLKLKGIAIVLPSISWGHKGQRTFRTGRLRLRRHRSTHCLARSPVSILYPNFDRLTLKPAGHRAPPATILNNDTSV